MVCLHAGGAVLEWRGLHAGRRLPRMCELRLLRRHDGAGVVQPPCESASHRDNILTLVDKLVLLLLLQFMAAGCVAVEVQRKPNKLKASV